ncbi:MFS transporter [Pseudomonas yamanorum]|jgi:MFS family permease|uniref:MFS transporter n=1 Tax=Pseudomonas yamanorum TaxID=515393 RepID=A0ABU1CYZ1_9PSED|nr:MULTISPECIES: MFS transporter [Pseudomonas]AMW83000.1 Permeases of the major facilitator superfamily [Pseudomonas yamanorum]MBV6663767.1 MFS transporter [Pseudomonas yamanorum]MDR0192496.1 MFS transporter [Pseudomonas yamanorum]NVZ90832.1 MFS transporter [Pseudomonas yamanorum]WVN19518.1 MFS transporter [Pseudomonas yamanorum]
MSKALTASATRVKPHKTPLSREQIRGFWAVYLGWVLDGVDSVIFALVLIPALTELLPNSGLAPTAANIAMYGSIMFGLFLVGWGLSFIWGPLADRFGRVKVLAASILVYSIFTGAAAFSDNIWQLAIFRLIAGIGVGGEWALAGTYVAESWPEDRRKMGAGYLQTGYYLGFFIAALLNYTVGATYGWRVMFLCGLFPAVVAIYTALKVKEPQAVRSTPKAGASAPWWEIFAPAFRRRTLTSSALVGVAIVGLWAGSVYEATAVVTLATRAGIDHVGAVHLASIGAAVLSLSTILGCLVAPWLAEQLGRRMALGIYFSGMAASIIFAFGWVFYLDDGLHLFMVSLVFLGFFGGNFAIFSLWLPEQYPTRIRATAFAFNASVGRFIGAGVNFLLAAAIHWYGSIGAPIAWTAAAFVLGVLILPFAVETRHQTLPQ